MMTTQQHPDRLSIEQTGGTRPERVATHRRRGWGDGEDSGFDDMNIPGWSDYVAARAAALGRLSRLETVRVASSADERVIDPGEAASEQNLLPRASQREPDP